jgi:hypothetical protein
MIYAEVLTPWVGKAPLAEPFTDPYRPQLMDHIPASVLRVTDTTHQPAFTGPDQKYQPNLTAVRAQFADQNALNDISTNAAYYVLWDSNVAQDEVPTNSEFGQLRAYLGQQGMDQEDLKDAVGNAPAGRTRAEIVAELKGWLRSRPLV